MSKENHNKMLIKRQVFRMLKRYGSLYSAVLTPEQQEAAEKLVKDGKAYRISKKGYHIAAGVVWESIHSRKLG